MSILVSPKGQHRAPRTSRRLTAERARGRTRAGVVAVSMLVSLFVAGPAHAEVLNDTTSTFPMQTTLGDTNVDFTITVRNTSTAPDDTIPLELNEAGMTPSCAQYSGVGVCVDPELDVFLLREGAAAAVGIGGSCVGDTFTVSARDGTGRHTITPEQTTTLGPADGSGPLPLQCTMELRILEVNRVPTTDAAPATPGIQTRSAVDSQVEDPPTGRQSGHFRTELVTVFPGQVTLETVSDPNRADGTSPLAPGGTATDTAFVERAPGFEDANPDPQGTVTFTLVGADPDANCTAPVAHGPETVAIDPGTGQAASSPTAPLNATGEYNWVATFESADNNYGSITTPVGCGDPLEIFDVQPAPTIDVVKTADPETQPAPTGTFTFTVDVTNTGVNPVTITSLDDDVYGDLNDPANPNVANNTCAGAVGNTLAPGGTFTCSFDGDFTGGPGDQQTDVVTATAEDEFGQEATDDDDAVVGLVLPAPPVIDIDKTADPLEQPAPGGNFTFTVVVTNTGPSRVTITELDDDIYGDLNDPGNPDVTSNTCANVVGTQLDPGETFACSFVGEFTGDEGDSQTDVVTAVAEDEFGQEAEADDDAVVTLGPPPMIQVVKTVDPETRPTPGGTFTYTVVVTNISATLPLAITALDDDIYGDLDDPANPDVENNTCAGIVGTVLQPDESITCTFDGEFTGVAGDEETDTVTVVGTDQFGNVVTDDDDATVTLGPRGEVIADEPPVIDVDKTPTPTELPVPGGEFTFTLTVTNPGEAPVTITSLVDDVHGDLDGQGTCAVGATLAAEGGTYTCQFTVTFTGDAGDSETDVITVIAVDEEGREAVDDDDAVITIVPAEEPPPPPVVEPPPPPAVPTPAQKLPVTGLDLMPLVAVAGALLSVGTVLLAKTPGSDRHARRGHRPRHGQRRPRLLRWALG